MTPPAPTGRRRGDIQGLRALAVLAVIAFHATGRPGPGWLGVDVFFVVSGYVITATLVRRAEHDGRVRLGDFWLRRARRILPLALLVIGTVLLVAPRLYAEGRVEQIRADGLWAAVFAANLRFWRAGSDYFGATDSPSPLLHFWSLAVEEQFYLLYPLLVLLVAAGRSGMPLRRRIGLLAVGVVGLSLPWALHASVGDPVGAYYAPWTRAWEIALGCLVATLPPRAAPRVRSRLSLVATGLVVVALTLPTGWAEPAPAALLACAATAAVLGCDGRNVLLDNPVLRWVGDLSYALYLWHLPALVLGARVWGDDARGVLLSLGATVALAVLSHHLLERPLMHAPLSGGARAWSRWWAGHRRGVGVALAAGLALAVAVPVAAQVASQRSSEPATTSPITASPTVTPSPTTASPTTASPQPEPADVIPEEAVTATTEPQQRPGLGATGERLQEGLRGGLALTAWPAGLYPGTGAGAPGEAPPWPGLAACEATPVSDPAACTWGDPGGEEIVVYGDSLGINLSSAVVAAYGEDYRVRGLTKLACAVNGVDADFGQPEWRIPCDDHRLAVIAYVKEHRPRALIMTEHYTWSTKLLSGAEGRAREDEWTAAVQAFVDEVAPYVEDVVLVAPSVPGVDFYDCYLPGGSPQACTHTVPDWFASTREAETRVEGVTFVDTTHWYCVDGSCPMVSTLGETGATRIKLDYVHVSYAYDVLLGEDLAWRLGAMGVEL